MELSSIISLAKVSEKNAERKKRLDQNEIYAFKQLKENNIQYKKLSDYGYFVEDTFDYWPRTGLFIHRENRSRGRGIYNLMKSIKKLKEY